MNEATGVTDEAGDPHDLEVAKADERAKRLEVELAKLGLNQQAIDYYDLDQLKAALERINNAIAHPEQFGALMSEIKPLLTQRKGLISNRIRNLEGDKQIEGLKGLVASVTDPALRSNIERELEELRQHSRQAADRDRDIAREQAEQIAARDATVARLRTEILERRLRAWTGFFARESMATYVGALLLILLTFVLIGIVFLPNPALRYKDY